MQLTAEQIHEFISKAIIDSQIGDAVRKSIDRVLKDLKSTYDNPIDKVVKQHIERITYELLIEENMPEFKEHIRNALDHYVTEKVVDNIVETAVNKLYERD